MKITYHKAYSCVLTMTYFWPTAQNPNIFYSDIKQIKAGNLYI